MPHQVLSATDIAKVRPPPHPESQPRPGPWTQRWETKGKYGKGAKRGGGGEITAPPAKKYAHAPSRFLFFAGLILPQFADAQNVGCE